MRETGSGIVLCGAFPRERIPPFLRRVLVVEAGPQPGAFTRAVQEDLPQAAVTSISISAITESGENSAPGTYDGVLISGLDGEEVYGIETILKRLSRCLIKSGWLLAGGCLGPREEGDCAGWRLRFSEVLREAGLFLYAVYPRDGGLPVDPIPPGGGTYWVHAVPDGYDPIYHARQIFELGRPDFAHEVLSAIPGTLLRDPAFEAQAGVEKMLYLVALASAVPRDLCIKLFWGSLMLFNRVTSLAPLSVDSYCVEAEFWRRMGDEGMAAGLLRTAAYAVPQTGAQLETGTSTLRDVRYEKGLTWSGRWHPRILMIVTPERPHYGMDVIYDGLRRVLGAGRVIEYPWKPTYHGRRPERFANYPSQFAYPDEPMPLEAVLAALSLGAFDVVLFSDVEKTVPRAEILQIMKAAQRTPVFLLDEQDDCVDNLPEMQQYLGGVAIRGYFKRELLECVDFGPAVFPCPFAYPDGQAMMEPPGPRPELFFWAGQLPFGMRRLFIGHMEALLGKRFDTIYSPADYAQAIRNARAGVSFHGAGFDCVRHWELPANGCLLVAHHLPIRIPEPFVDGETALFFGDLREFEEKIIYCQAHPDEVTAMARAGHAHFLAHHTGSARARQMLGAMERVLGIG